jgi:uncharacterized protein (DUF1330 family)
MSAYAIFDVDIRDMTKYQEFMTGVKPALERAGAKYLARGGAHRVYEGDWQPRRIVLLEFPSLEAFDSFYNGPAYRNLKGIRDQCSSARLVSVQGSNRFFE